MDKKQAERVQEFYHPEIWDDLTFILHTPGERVAYLHFNRQKKVVLTFRKQIEGDEMGDTEIIVTTEQELGKMLFPEHYENIRTIIEPDSRMKKYLQRVKRGIRLLEIKHGYGWEDCKTLEQYDIWGNLTGSGYVDVGQISDNLWVAQYSVRTAIDDYDVTRMYFKKCPSRKDVITAKALEDIETYFTRYGWDKAVSYCYECGREFHFCDIKGDLKQKFDNFRNHYCGC